MSRKMTTRVLTFVNEQQAKLFTHFRGWSGSEAKCGPIKFLSIIIVHDRIPPNYDVKFSFIFQINMSYSNTIILHTFPPILRNLKMINYAL